MNTPALKSALHWRNDILAPLEAGIGIVKIALSLYWDTPGVNTLVRVGCSDCDMCRAYHCKACPLAKEGQKCIDRNVGYGNFCDNPCIATAQAMVDTLERIAREYDERGNKIGE